MGAVIVGAGKLGQAVGMLLQEGGVDHAFWDVDPDKVAGQRPLEELLPAADVLFLCVPSWAVGDVAKRAQASLRAQCGIVSFSKGIERESLRTMAELLPDIFPGRPFAVVGGPMLADEISLGKAAIGVIGSPDEAFRERMGSMFASPRFRVETTADAFSVSLAGVAKNVYAVALGIADGLELSGNEKGWLVANAITEMAGIADALAADRAIMLGTAGVGDLIATGYSQYSRNRQVGDEIVRTGACQLPGEGLVSLPHLLARLGEKGSAFPLLQLVKAAGLDCWPAAPMFKEFFSRPAYAGHA